MDLYNLVTKIPYIIMLITGITIILQLYIGGLHELTVEADVIEEENVRAAAGAEQMISGNLGESDSEYERRGEIPIELVQNDEPEEGEAGFREIGGNCYTEHASLIDGSELAFGLVGLDGDFDNKCEPDGSLTETPAILRGPEGKSHEVLLVVYEP